MNDAALMPRGPRYQVVFFDLYGTHLRPKPENAIYTGFITLASTVNGMIDLAHAM